jgi:hypothetical protein
MAKKLPCSNFQTLFLLLQMFLDNNTKQITLLDTEFNLQTGIKTDLEIVISTSKVGIV